MMPKHALAPAEVLPPPEQRQVTAEVTGAHIVHMADHVEWMESQPDDAYDPDAAGQMHEQLLTKVEEFRTQLGALSDAEKNRLDPYIQSLLPRHRQYMYADRQNRPTVKTLERMDEAGIVSFFRGHVAVVEQLEKDMAPFIDERKQVFVNQLSAGVAEQWVSPAILASRDDLLDTPVYVGDWWETALQNEDDGRFDYKGRYAVLRQGIGRSREQRNADFMRMHGEALPHELMHGRDVSKKGRDEWLLEAGAEHIALAASDGEPGIIHPGDRAHDSGVYTSYRGLAATMVDGIHPFIFTRAVTSGSMQSAEWQQLEVELARKYDVHGVVGRISRRWVQHIAANKNHPELTADQVSDRAAMLVARELQESPWVVMGVTPDSATRVGALAAGTAIGYQRN